MEKADRKPNQVTIIESYPDQQKIVTTIITDPSDIQRSLAHKIAFLNAQVGYRDEIIEKLKLQLTGKEVIVRGIKFGCPN